MSDELQKNLMKTAAPQQIHTEQTSILQSYHPLNDAELQTYAHEQSQHAQNFIDQYTNRMRNAHLALHPEDAVQTQTRTRTQQLQPVPVEQPAQVPELTDKELKEKRKLEAKNLKQGQKLTPAATAFTVPLIEQMKKRVDLQDATLPMTQKFIDHIRENTPAAEQEAKIRAFGSLMFFAPSLEYDKKKNITDESNQKQNDFMNHCLLQPEAAIQEVKEQMLTKTFHPEFYTPEYVSGHFDEVRQELDQMKGFLALFREGTPEYEKLTPYERAQAALIGEVSAQSERAFRSALSVHGLTYTDQGLVPLKEKDDNATQNNNDDTNSLRALTENLTDRKKQFIDEESDRQIESTYQEREHAYDELRRDMKADPKTSFIESDRLSNVYQYDTIREAKEMIEQFSDKYQEHKAFITPIYQDLLNLMDSASLYSMKCQAINDATYDTTKVKDREIQNALAAKMEIYKSKYESLLDRGAHLMASLKYFLRGKELGDADAMVLSEYGYQEPAYAEKVKNDAAAANIYAETNREKSALFHAVLDKVCPEQKAELLGSTLNRCVMLMKPEDPAYNEMIANYMVKANGYYSMKKRDPHDPELPAKELEIATVAKQIALPYLDAFMKAGADDMHDLSDTELLARQKDLILTSLPDMMINDMAKLKDPDDPSVTIRDAFVKEKGPLFALRCSTLENSAKKARALAMIEAYKNGTLTEDALAPAELKKLKNRDAVGPLTPEQILEYAKTEYAVGTRQIESARNRYGQDKSMIQTILTHKKAISETSHPAFMQKQEWIIGYLESLAQQKTQELGFEMGEDSVCRSAFLEARKKITELTGQIENETDVRKKESLMTQLTEQQELAEWLEIRHGLSRSQYQMAGDTQELIREPIFRAYSSSDELPAIRSMSEEKFHDMCRKLAAGTMQEDTDPEQIAVNRAKNVEGLLMYKEVLSAHYSYLEQKYHHVVPTVEYVQTHLDEIERDFSNIQVDNNLITHSADMIHQDNPEDLKLYHLVHFYNQFGGALLTFRHGFIGVGQYDDKTADTGIQNFLKEAQDSWDYVRSNFP